MIKKGRGTLKQGFKVRLDIEKIIDYIVDGIAKEISSDLDDVDIDEWDVDGFDLEIFGTYKTDFKSWWCSATLESPEEHDIDRKYIGVVSLCCLPEELRKLITVNELKEDEEDVDYGEPYDPRYDDNDAYDRWRDRQFEGDE